MGGGEGSCLPDVITLVWIGEGDSAYLEKEGGEDGEGRVCLQVLSPLQLGPEKAEWH